MKQNFRQCAPLLGVGLILAGCQGEESPKAPASNTLMLLGVNLKEKMSMTSRYSSKVVFAFGATVMAWHSVAGEGWHVGGMVGIGTASQSAEHTHTEWVYGGYGVTNWLDIGLGVSAIGATDQNDASVKPALYNRAKYTLSEEDSMYVGLGIRGVDSLTAEVGWLHRFSEPLSLNIGYRYQHQPFKVEEGDLYTLGIGLEWRWRSAPLATSRSSEEVETFLRPVSEPRESSVALVQHSEPDLLAPTDELCPKAKDIPLKASETTRSYTIVPGDWASKIAPAHCVTLAWLEAMNPWLAERNARKAYIFPGETLLVPSDAP